MFTSVSKQTKVAILDTGLNASQFSGINISQAKSFVDLNPLSDKQRHGNLMMNILLETLAPDVPKQVLHFIIAQVIKEGRGTAQNIIDAFEWLTPLKPDLILIPSGFVNEPLNLKKAIDNLLQEHTIPIIAAAGNLFFGQDQPLFPAAWKNVMAIGCQSDMDAYQHWSIKPDMIIDFSRFKNKALILQNESTSAACMIMGAMALSETKLYSLD